MKVRIVGDSLSLDLFSMAGITGECPQSADEVKGAIDRFIAESEVGVVLVTSSRAAMLGDGFRSYLLRRDLPVVLRIPDRESAVGEADEIKDTLQRSLGIKL